MPRLKYYNTKTNTWEYVSADGKSAYDYAKDAGFTGTEEEFSQKLVTEVDDSLSIESRAADAKAVGDALANKIEAPSTATVGQTIAVKSVDESNKPTDWETINMPVKNIEDVTHFVEQTRMTGFYFYLANPLPNGFYYYDMDKYGKMLYAVIINAEGTAVDKNFSIYYPRLFHINSNDTDIIITVYNSNGAISRYSYDIANKIYNFENLAYNTKTVDELLNNKISSPTIAEIGQLLSVKAIDENGKPTEWEASNIPSIDGLATEEYVNSAIANIDIPEVDGVIKYNEVQELTDEQRKQARYNISKFNWITFSDSYGTYIYAISENSVNYEIAKTITNATNNGNINAMDDIISWLYSIVSEGAIASSSEAFLNTARGIASDCDALVNGGAISSNYVIKAVTCNKFFEEANSQIFIEPIGNNIIHIYAYNYYYNTVINVHYDKNTDTITEFSSKHSFITDNFSSNGYAANAKAVGDALTTKIDRSEIEEIDAIEILAETGLISPIAAEDGSAYTDENGAMYSL